MTYSIEAYNYIRTGSQAGGHVLVKESEPISDETCIARQIRNFERAQERRATLEEIGRIRDEYFGLSIK